MPALCRRLSFRNIEIFDDTAGQTVAVRLRNGEFKQVTWLGFIDRIEARRLRDAVPVKLDAVRFSNAAGVDWVDLRPNEFVQGCLTADGAYAVTETGIRIIRIR